MLQNVSRKKPVCLYRLQTHGLPFTSPKSGIQTRSTFGRSTTRQQSFLVRAEYANSLGQRRCFTNLSENRQRTELLQRIKSSEAEISWGVSSIVKGDFRSDVITRPSLQMLEALINTTLGDDVFREDTTTTQFERNVAKMLGHEAGCFVVTGTMANQLALRALLHQPPYAVLCDAKAHIINYEGAGPALMCSALVQPIQPTNGMYLTAEDVVAHAITTDDIHKCPTKVISLENTCAGMAVPLDEMEKIRQWTREHDIQIHLDGARLWEAAAASEIPLEQYGALADCVAVDFSKGLGAPMGAMVLGKAETIHQVRRIRKSTGGGLRQAGVLSSMAWAALQENFDKPRIRGVHKMAADMSKRWTSRGGKMLYPTETNQLWVDLAVLSVSSEDFIQMGRQHGLILDGPRIVFHNQIGTEAVSDLGKMFDKLLAVN